MSWRLGLYILSFKYSKITWKSTSHHIQESSSTDLLIFSISRLFCAHWISSYWGVFTFSYVNHIEKEWIIGICLRLWVLIEWWNLLVSLISTVKDIGDSGSKELSWVKQNHYKPKEFTLLLSFSVLIIFAI